MIRRLALATREDEGRAVLGNIHTALELGVALLPWGTVGGGRWRGRHMDGTRREVLGTLLCGLREEELPYYLTTFRYPNMGG